MWNLYSHIPDGKKARNAFLARKRCRSPKTRRRGVRHMHFVRLVLLLLPHLAVSEPAPVCSAEFTACFDTRCCSNHGFACYKRAGVLYAQCKRKGTPCGVADPGWECPVDPEEDLAADDPTSCGHDYKPCFSSNCCLSPGFGCFKRPGLRFAQCRPMPMDPTRRCVSTDEWECPGTEPPPTPEELGKTCAQPFDNCFDSKCCAGALFNWCVPVVLLACSSLLAPPGPEHGEEITSFWPICAAESLQAKHCFAMLRSTLVQSRCLSLISL